MMGLNQFYNLIEGSQYGEENLLPRMLKSYPVSAPSKGNYNKQVNSDILNNVLKPRIDGFKSLLKEENQEKIKVLHEQLNNKEISLPDFQKQIRDMMTSLDMSDNKYKININIDKNGNLGNLDYSWKA